MALSREQHCQLWLLEKYPWQRPIAIHQGLVPPVLCVNLMLEINCPANNSISPTLYLGNLVSEFWQSADLAPM